MAFQQQRSRPRVQRDSHEDHHHHHHQALSQTVPHRAPLGAGAHSDHATSLTSAGAARGTDTGAGTGHGAAENIPDASSHAPYATWHEDDEVLLFGGASASASAADSSSWYAHGNGSTPLAPLAAGDDWTLLSAPAHHHRHPHPYQRTLSPAATRSSTSTSTSATSSFELGAREGGDLSVSLFPAHDGNGRFLSLSSDSLVNSTLYDRAESSTHASSDANSSSFVRTHRLGPRPIASDGSQWSDVADPDSAEYMRRPPTSISASSAAVAPTHASSSLSASSALTEAALSTIPDASIGRRIVLRRPEDRVAQEEVEQEDDDRQSAGFTSGSSVEDEHLPPRERRRRAASRRVATPTARLIPIAPLQSREDEEEDMLCRTPGAESAGLHLNSRQHLRAVPSTYEEHRTHGGLHSSQRSREAYPSPPPEDRLSASKSSVKRRHRQSGRSGSSQKRSSTSGSIRHPSIRHASLANTMPTIAQLLEEKQMAEARREEVQSQIWLGSLVTGKTMGIDAETLEMVAAAEPLTPEATPTPSRAGSPRLRNRTHELGNVHGIAALMRHAERELGTEASKICQLHEAEATSEEEEEEEDETDTERFSSKSPTVAWHRTTEPLVFAPRHATIPNEAILSIEASRENPSRSFSTSSLPMYLADHSLKVSSGRLGPLTSTSSTNYEDPVSDLLRLRRRTTSFTNSLNSNSDESPWGGEFDGLEAAIVYWRSLWRKIRGLSA